MTTWAQLISLALRDSGVVGMGQTPNAQMQQDAKQRCNMMLDEWRADNMLVYQTLDLAKQCDGGTNYSIGPGGDFDVAVRPDALSGAYLRQLVANAPNLVDYQLEVLESMVDYSRISMKTLTAAPAESVFLDTGYPTGQVYIWPLPNSSWELHILINVLLDKIVNLTDVVVLPPRYERAIYTNLCVDLGSAFRIDPKPTMLARASASLKAIRRKNSRTPRLQMPYGMGMGVGYNVFSDRGR